MITSKSVRTVINKKDLKHYQVKPYNKTQNNNKTYQVHKRVLSWNKNKIHNLNK